MQRVILFLLLLFLPSAALADGMVVPTVAYPASVTIPDQRALICFSNGTERLVIETRFTGAGTNFAWVVPLPSQPVMEEATTGLFPTLQYLFRPHIVTDVPAYFPWISGIIWMVYVLLFVRPTGRMTVADIASCILVAVCIALIPGTDDYLVVVPGVFSFIFLMVILAFIRRWKREMYGLACALLTLFMVLQFLAASAYVTSYQAEQLLEESGFWFFLALDIILIITLALWKNTSGIICAVVIFFLTVFAVLLLLPAKSRSMGISSPSMPVQAVSILDRKIVGIFDTTTIASHDANALQNWLAENDYSVPTNAGPVIADYVKNGWVFVAAKIRRDDASQDTLTPQPLSFTFRTDKPVYPMRLTGLANQSLSVDIYVFGGERAEAPHFTVERCTQPKYPDIAADSWSWDWRYWSPETPEIVHPLLRQWTGGLPVATKLTGQLSADDMRQDVWLDWTPFAEKKNEYLNRSAAMRVGLNWGAGFFALGLFWIWLFAFGSKSKAWIPKRIGILTLATITLTGSIYLCQPKMAARMVQIPYGAMENRMFELDEVFSESISNQMSLPQVGATVDNTLHVPQTNWFEDWNGWVKRVDHNDYLNGPLREEDSPGNYTVRDINGQWQLIGYDAEGGEHVMPALGQ